MPHAEMRLNLNPKHQYAPGVGQESSWGGKGVFEARQGGDRHENHSLVLRTKSKRCHQAMEKLKRCTIIGQFIFLEFILRREDPYNLFFFFELGNACM